MQRLPGVAQTQASWEMLTRAGLTHHRPDYGFKSVMVDGRAEPAYNGWVDPADPPLSFQGSHVTIKVLERGAVQITKNGAVLAAGDPDVTFE